MRIAAATEVAQHVDHLSTAEVRPQVHLTGHVRQASVQADRVAPRVAAEQGEPALVGAEHPEQDPDRRRLAGPVGSEEAVHLPRPYLQVEMIKGSRVGSEVLD